MAISDRLQALLDTARTANSEPDRTSKIILYLMLHLTNMIKDTSVSRAVQTEAATISLWNLLPRARKEAYQRGFTAGHEQGRDEGIAEGVSISNAEGLVTGLEQSKMEEPDRGFEMGRQAGYNAGLAEGMRRATEDAKKKCDITVVKSKQKEAVMREKIIVRLTPTTPTAANKALSTATTTNEAIAIITNKTIPTVPNGATPTTAQQDEKVKENLKAKHVDPFASLVGLARMR
jgi:flagellar biosynthesis/type III secretory pathway protein FliH